MVPVKTNARLTFKEDLQDKYHITYSDTRSVPFCGGDGNIMVWLSAEFSTVSTLVMSSLSCFNRIQTSSDSIAI